MGEPEKKKNSAAKCIDFADKSPLFLIGLLVLLAVFGLYLKWGSTTVFDIHDQLDETICSYVIPARHPFFGMKTYPEMMCELPADSMKSSAPLFTVLYRIFPVEWAFLVQFFLLTLTAFFGMYFLIKRITQSSIAAILAAMIFAFLPFQPVYGLNVMGIPLLFLCFYELFKTKSGVKTALWCLGILYFASCTHIALAGYVAILVALGLLIAVLKKDAWKWKEHLSFTIGVLVLIAAYALLNMNLILSLVFGSGDFVSHRTEFVASPGGGNFLSRVFIMLNYGEENYAPSLHRMVLPFLVIFTVLLILRFRKLSKEMQEVSVFAFLGLGLIGIICVLYGVLGSEWVANLKNNLGGFIKYTDLDRFYYFLPGLWWAVFGIEAGILIKESEALFGAKGPVKPLVTAAVILCLLPTLFMMKKRINIYDNINYHNNGSGVTGTMSMSEYYRSDLMKLIDEHIGRDKSTYRVAHLGISPAPSLVYGFYTVDGYSNNYPLEYKHNFRKVIAQALSEDEVLATYFDTWGSRAYLYLGDSHITEEAYHNLPYDFEVLKGLNCRYLFSDREIEDTPGLAFEGEFVSGRWGSKIYLYRLE